MGCGASANENMLLFGPMRLLGLAGLSSLGAAAPSEPQQVQAARGSTENQQPVVVAPARVMVDRRPIVGKVVSVPGVPTWYVDGSHSSSLSNQGSSMNDDDLDLESSISSVNGASISSRSDSSQPTEEPPPWSTTPPNFRFLSGCTVPSLEYLGPSDTVHNAKRRIASKMGLQASDVQVLSGSDVLPEHWTLLELSGADLLVVVADMCEADEYIVRFDRSSGTRLGIDVDHRDGESLIIESIASGSSGLVAEWNTKNPELAVSVGDRIVAANGVSKDAMRMVEECKRLGPVKVKLRRPGLRPQQGASAAT